MNQNQTVIGGRTISVGTIPPKNAIKVQLVIGKVCGEALFRSVATAKDEKDMISTASVAIGTMMSRMDADELIATMETVFEFVTIDGKRVMMEQDFNGRNLEMWQVFIFALRVNFRDFFPETLLASIRAKMAALSKSSSPQTSTGTSGGQ